MVSKVYVTFVKTPLQDIGLHGIWLDQEDITFSPNWFKENVKRRLSDSFIHNWYISIDQGSMFLNYRMFKTMFVQERYISLLPTNLAIRLARFRTTNNSLPVNKLRFDAIPRDERLCQKCPQREVGDEFHYIFFARILMRSEEHVFHHIFIEGRMPLNLMNCSTQAKRYY